jgi:hypothetical protein
MRRAVVLLAFAGFVLASCGEQGSIGGLLVLEGEHTVAGGETLYGDLFVLDGEVLVAHGGRITGSAFVLGGRVEIAGSIDGDVAVVGGDVQLTEAAVLRGGLRRGGGQVRVAPGASVGSELVSPVAVDAVIGLTRPAADAEQPSGWLIVQLLVLVLFAAIVAWFAPRVVVRTGAAVALQPLVPMAVGVLALIVGVSLLVFMVFTVVLIPVALLMALTSLLGTAIGLVGLAQRGVRRVAGAGALGGRRVLQSVVGTTALTVGLWLASLLPLVGEIAMAVVVTAALGSWLVTRFGTRDLVLAAA